MKKFMLLFACMFYFLSVASCFAVTQVHTDSGLMDSIGKPFDNETWSPDNPNYRVDTGYTGSIDRRVFKSGDVNTDETVLIANRVYNTVMYDGQTEIQQIDNAIKEMQYDPRPTTEDNSRSVSKVVRDRTGNCFEIARFAKYMLDKSGYETKLIDIKINGMDSWHTICAFRERNNTWSYFQAAGGEYMGYFKVQANDIASMVSRSFLNIANYQIN